MRIRRPGTETLEQTASGVRCLALLLALVAAFVARLETRALMAAQGGEILAPPRAGLVAVHLPDLRELEPDVRDQLTSFQKALDAQTKDRSITDLKLSEAYGLMGQVYHAYSLNSPARECYLNARQLAPKDFRWSYLLGSIAKQEGRVDEALRYYKLARGSRPDYLAAPVQLGNLYLQLNRLDEARWNFKDALAINSHCTAARYGLGQVALSSRKYSEAVEYLEQALAEAPEATRIHYALAMSYRGMGNINKAEAHLRQQGPVGIRVADPLVDGLQELIGGERLHLVRGRMAFDAQRFSEAASEFRKAVAANPASVTARVNLGSALAKIGQIREAIDEFQEAIRINPSNAVAQYNLGALLGKQNQHDRAVLHLRSALTANPQDVEARFLLAQQLLKSARPEEALTEFSRVVESDPGNEEALLEFVKLLFAKKQYKQAIDRLEKGNALFPQRGRTAVMLAYLLASSPQYDLRDGTRALTLAKLVYQSTGLVNHGVVVAMALAELGRCNEAAELQQQLIPAAERDQKVEIVLRMKADLKRYESSQCRPQGDTEISAPPTQDESKRPKAPEFR